MMESNQRNLAVSSLPRTRRGRIVIPRLKTWAGERVRVLKHGNLVYDKGHCDYTSSFQTGRKRPSRPLRQHDPNKEWTERNLPAKNNGPLDTYCNAATSKRLENPNLPSENKRNLENSPQDEQSFDVFGGRPLDSRKSELIQNLAKNEKIICIRKRVVRSQQITEENGKHYLTETCRVFQKVETVNTNSHMS